MTKNRKIKIIKVTPNISREQLSFEQKCFIAVSMNNTFFLDSNKLLLLLEYIDSRFKECIVVIADELYRHNLASLDGMSSSRAHSKSLTLGDNFLKLYNNLPFVAQKCLFSVRRWSEFLQDQRYLDYKEQLEHLRVNNMEFQVELESTSIAFVDRQLKNGLLPKGSYTYAQSNSENYILEELAVYAILVDDGFSVDLYPGSYLPVLDGIVTKKYADSPESLINKINVQIKSVKKGS